MILLMSKANSKLLEVAKPPEGQLGVAVSHFPKNQREQTAHKN
jgi:hypothetical protein